MKRLIWIAVSLGVFGSFTAAGPPADRTPVLVELFTSEGCSSCPPADRLLETLDRTQPVAGAEIIVLSEHVDYWNRLGWTDPYSSPVFSERQQGYVTAFGIDSAYTPQMVIDGRTQLVGSENALALSAVAKAVQIRKTPVTLSEPVRDGRQVKVKVTAASLGAGEQVFVALAENEARSQVTRGENAGRMLPHVAVVRTLVAVGGGSGSSGGAFQKDVTLSLPAPAAAVPGGGGLRLVAFVQNQKSKQIQGAALVRL